MSLINDALKRAKESQPATTPAPEPEQPMKPVEPPPSPAPARGLPPYFLPAVLIVLSGACWFLVKGWETKRQAGIYPPPLEVKAREITPAPTPESPAAATASRQFALTNLSQAATSSVATAPEAAPEPPPRPQPVFRLQGIFYRPSSPSAVINTKTVFVGDIVDQARVKAIDRQSVTLVHDGQTKVLTLQ